MSEWRRLHPIAVVTWLLDGMKQFWFALAPILFSSGRARMLSLVAFATILSIGATIRWLRFRYMLTADALVMEGGVVHRWEKTIPRARIQSLDLNQKLRHRLLGLVEVRVEIIGGRQEPEGRLRAVSRAEADRLRRELLRTPDVAVGSEIDTPLVVLDAGGILLAGLTGGRVAVTGLIFFAFMQYLPESQQDRLGKGIGSFIETSGQPRAVTIALLVLTALFAIAVLGLAMTVITFWGFEVRREGDRIMVSRGLLDRRRSIVPLRRIQAVRIHQNLLRRMFGWASVSVVVAGYGPQAEKEGLHMLLPVGTLQAARTLAAFVIPQASLVDNIELEPAPLRARGKRILRALLESAVIVAFLVVRFGSAGYWSAFILPFAVAWGVASYRALGHALAQGAMLARSGVLDRVVTVVPMANVQRMRLTAGPLQRIRRLAELRVVVPRGKAVAEDLDRSRAEERFREVALALGAPVT